MATTPVRSQRVTGWNRDKARVRRSSSTHTTIVRPTHSENTISRGQVSSVGNRTYSSVAARAQMTAAAARARTAPLSVSGHSSAVGVDDRYMVGGTAENGLVSQPARL